MNRLLIAAGVVLIAVTTLLYVAILTEKEPPVPSTQTKKAGGFVILTPLEAIEKQRKHEEQVDALLKDATAAHLAQQLAQEEAQALRRQVAALEAEIAKLKTPRRTEVAPGAQAGTFEASHYTAYCTGCSGVTATGLNVSDTIYSPDGFRIVATDPRVIPLGTILKLTYADGTTFTAIAADTGGAIKGRKLDVLVASRAEAYALGRVAVQVEIVSK